MKMCTGCSLAAAALVGASVSTAFADTVVVRVFDFDFEALSGPADPTINIGDTIRWDWDGGFHSSTSSAGQAESWDSDLTADTDYFFEHTFTNVGVFEYYCQVHGFDNGNGTAGGMSGTITVVPVTGTAPALAMALLVATRRRRR